MAEPRDSAALIIDSFAGGGGASTGIELALGRSPDVAINHDANALALHRANHPDTLHLTTDIWGVDPATVAAGRKIGLLWASPTCTHFSKAKGGALVDRNIRDLAWVVCRWAELPRATKPRVIILENVEEFRGWGPVGENGKPVKEFSGVTYEAWVQRLKAAGYKVQWRELRACDYGAPTIRKRLFVIARSDGKSIVWPTPTHGDPKSKDVLRGKLLPWRTAAECIDWSLPCPSIFDSSAEIMAKHGLRAKRPLADATLRRIARGIMRYVVDSPRPFIVPTTHPRDVRTHDSLDPLPTVTNGGGGRGEHALVMPIISYAQQGGGNRPVDAPLHTLCASPKDQNTLVAATMVQTGYGERPGQEPRSLDIEAPIGTQVAGGSKHAVVAAFLAQHNAGPRNEGISGRELDVPISTVTGAGAQQQLVAASLTLFNGDPNEQSSDGTGAGDDRRWRDRGAARRNCVAPKGWPEQREVRADRPEAGGVPADERLPGSDDVERGEAVHGSRSPAGMDQAEGANPARGGHQSSERQERSERSREPRTGEPVGEPSARISHGAEGALQEHPAPDTLGRQDARPGTASNWPELREDRRGVGGFADDCIPGGQRVAAFICKYYGTGDGARLDEPMHTDTTRDRMGLVAVEIDGTTYAIVDIGMRMLTPRERFLAQGFPVDYEIATGIGPDGESVPLTLDAQGRACGNSVCPPLARALAAENCGDLAVGRKAEVA